jgi:hypothetical protein
MKKNTFSLSSLAMLFSAAIIIASCTGDDGAPGPAGTNGTNGTNGTDGKNGTNGAGFDEAIAKGNVIVMLDGTRPDGVAFKDTVDYRFSNNDMYYSSFYDDTQTGEGEDSDIETRIQRYQGYDGGGYVSTNTKALVLTGITSKLLSTDMSTNNTIISFPAEHKFFYLEMYPYFNQSYNSETNQVDIATNLSDLTLTSYDYNVPTTGKAAYKYSGTLDGGSNSTGNDLKITVIVNATVYKSIQSINGGDRHDQGDDGRTAAKAVVKAEMQSTK